MTEPMTPERLAEIRHTHTDPRWLGPVSSGLYNDDVGDLLAEVDRLTAERDRLAGELRQADEFGRGEFRVTAWAYDQACRALAARTAERDETRRKLVSEQARRNRLAGLLTEVLEEFVHRGHPGEPCHQTGWVPDRTLDDWRRRFRAAVAGWPTEQASRRVARLGQVAGNEPVRETPPFRHADGRECSGCQICLDGEHEATTEAVDRG